MSNEELFKNYQALDIETNQLKPRFHDSENKMFSAFDDDILRLQANNPDSADLQSVPKNNPNHNDYVMVFLFYKLS